MLFKKSFSVKDSKILCTIHLHTCKCKDLVKMVPTLEGYCSQPAFGHLFFTYLLSVLITDTMQDVPTLLS